MALQHFRPRTRDFGAMFLTLQTGNINSITANTTNTFGIGGLADKDDSDQGRVAWINEIIVGAVTAPADADGTILLSIKKYDASAGSAVTLVTGATTSVSTGDLEALTAGKAERLTFDTLTDAQRTLDQGDFLYAEIVNNSAALNTQPVGLQIVAGLKILR